MTKEALQSIIAGDNAGYEEMYINYSRKFFNYGRKFTVDTLIIEDTIQEVFMDMWHKRQTLSQVQSLNSYLFSSFRYILLRKIKLARQTLSTEDFNEEPDFFIEQKIILKETDLEIKEKLQFAIDALTPRQREVIFLRFYEAFSYEEIAPIMGITIKATYKVMARSLDSLKEKLSLSILALMTLLIAIVK